MAAGERVFLATVQGKFWRFDVKGIVGSVLLGIVMNLIQQVTERSDAALTGGAFVILGGMSVFTVGIVAAAFFRFPGVLITWEVHALISTVTAASPMSPAFILANFLAAVPLALLVWKLPLTRWWDYPLVIFPSFFFSMLGIAFGLAFILQLPTNIILISFLVTWLSGSVVSSVLGALLVRAIDRSGVLD